MRAELIELLRCPRPHEPTPLVTVAYARDSERLLAGMLGCPVCGAEFGLRDGVADLRIPAVSNSGETVASTPTDPNRIDSTPDAARTAALLALVEPSMRVALCGDYAVLAADVMNLADAQCVALNASAPDTTGMADELQCPRDGLVPLADASLSGMAVDRAHIGLLVDASRVVRVGGRIVAPAQAPMPEGCEELARDEAEWVAVVTTAPAKPVTLRRSESVA